MVLFILVYPGLVVVVEFEGTGRRDVLDSFYSLDWGGGIHYCEVIGGGFGDAVRFVDFF